ncbi:MAG: nucleoside-diphosphate kinase [Deltaproteobacteria bacterium]|nr:nucleoside-diphosphate kinase [Deltaproteobacteria bacterium]
METTFAIVKPDAVSRGLIGAIIKMIEENGLKVKSVKMIHLTKQEAEGFYAVHRERPFFDSVTNFMSSGPCVVMVLTGEDAITRYRKLMGATNPENAEAGTIRKFYGSNVEANAVHGSDSPGTAATEIPYFFSQMELVN